MSISICTSVSDSEKRTKKNLDKLRALFNGSNVEIDGKRMSIGDSITKYYGDIRDDFGKRMFDEIVWRGTYKPAVDSYTNFTDGDFRRIKNEIIKESKNLNNPKLNYLEKFAYVKRGVMQKFAVTKYLNDKINLSANYERTQFSKYLSSHIDITKLLRTEILSKKGRKKGQSKFKLAINDPKSFLGIKTVKDLDKLENDLIIAINSPKSQKQLNEVNNITNEISRVMKETGGEVLEDLRIYLEGGDAIDKKNNKVFKIVNGKSIELSRNVINAGKISRKLLDNMGDVLINGLKQHKEVIRQAYLNTKSDKALLTENGGKVKRYEQLLDKEIKAIQEGKEGGNYFPHYLVESFINIEKVMDRAESDNYSNPDRDLSDLSKLFSEMRQSMGSPKSARFRKSIPYDNYLKNPISVLRKYSLDAIAFNKANFLKNTYMEGIRKLPKDSEAAEGLSKYIDDAFTLAEKGYSDRPSWVNKTVRTLTGAQFLSKLGFGIGTAARNTLSGMYYIQGVGNRAFTKYLRDWNSEANSDIRDEIRKVEQEQGFKFEDMASPIFTEGLVPTEGIKSRDIDIKEDANGNHVLQYKEGKNWRAFDSALTSATGKGAIFQRVTENYLRKHMFRYSFVSKYNELIQGGLEKQSATQRSKNYALDMVNKYAFEYSPSQKAAIVGGSRKSLGAVGQIAFQFMHYPMSFLQLQSEVLRKSKDAVIAGQWDSQDLAVPIRFAGLYLFTEMMSGVMNLDFHRLMENDTVERIRNLKESLDGKDVKGRGFLGPTIGELYYYASLYDFIKTPDNIIANTIVGYSDAYGMTDEQKRARLLSSLNVQASKFITKDYKALRNGNGWDLLMHEFSLYPTKETRAMRKKEPLKTLLPPIKKKTKSTKKESKDELSKLYRAMGI
tara:strand:+ start:12139 stop:14823 length:2685 start_codon:yes stop_codon:yes gene_type:complete